MRTEAHVMERMLVLLAVEDNRQKSLGTVWRLEDVDWVGRGKAFVTITLIRC